MSFPGMPDEKRAAVLALADGTVFSGYYYGAECVATGELVFHTAMSGYQEILSDPSYCQQIITFTYPHIGNVGCNSFDDESRRCVATGCVIAEMSQQASSWRSTENLADYLQRQNVIAITGIDTRALVRLLRDNGSQMACIMPGADAQAAISRASSACPLSGQDLTADVTCREDESWQQGSNLWPSQGRLPVQYSEKSLQQSPQQSQQQSSTHRSPSANATVNASANVLVNASANAQATSTHDSEPLTASSSPHVVVVDYGVKQSILSLLVDRGCRVTSVPAQTSCEDILKYKPDGVLLSNGPGDPAACASQLKVIEDLLQQKKLPLLGICLGFQLLARACGAKTYKMAFGHHGANHPVLDLETKKVYISSQNHGFAVDEDSLSDDLQATQRSLFDGSLQGFSHRKRPIFALQGHPEAGPGPHDMNVYFDRFLNFMRQEITDAKT